MSSIYTYFGFGLNISSELYFPEFLSSKFDLADVFITLKKKLDQGLDEVGWEKSFSHETELGTIFQVVGVARYHVKNGKEIEVEPHETAEPGAVRLFLLSNAMAILLIQRGQILLHASAIRQQHGLVVFVGESGAGKSSMLAELIRRGYEPFSDDVIVLEEIPATGEVRALPSYPMIKLWKETMDRIGTDLIGKGYQLRKGVEKFGHFFHDRYSVDPMPIHQVIVLQKDPNCETYEMHKPGGLEAFEILSQNIYRRQYIQEANLRKKHLRLLAGLLKNAEINVLKRPAGGGSIEGFSDFTEALLIQSQHKK